MKTEEDLLRAFEDVIEECKDQSSWLKNASLKLKDCFAMIQKHAISSDEMISYYWKSWLPYQIETRDISNATEEELEKFWKDYRERLLIVARSAAIFSLSIVEYVMKTTIKDSESGPLYDWHTRMTGKEKGNLLSRFITRIMEMIGKRRGRYWLYLSRITKESKKKKLIEKPEYKSWTGMIELRNAIVHNNAIADRTATLKIGELKINMEKGKMVQTKIMNYPHIIRVLVSLTRSWIESYLKSHTF
jgi:hypothetical protein